MALQRRHKPGDSTRSPREIPSPTALTNFDCAGDDADPHVAGRPRPQLHPADGAAYSSPWTCSRTASQRVTVCETPVAVDAQTGRSTTVAAAGRAEGHRRSTPPIEGGHAPDDGGRRFRTALLTMIQATAPSDITIPAAMAINSNGAKRSPRSPPTIPATSSPRASSCREPSGGSPPPHGFSPTRSAEPRKRRRKRRGHRPTSEQPAPVAAR